MSGAGGLADWSSAEENAISLAATTGCDYLTIISDCKTACHNHQVGRVSAQAIHILDALQSPLALNST